MIYPFQLGNKLNLITAPKHGCTQIIKIVSELLGIFDAHGHDYLHNDCAAHGTIHACGVKMGGFDPGLPTYIVTRKIEEKLLSYFLANYSYTFSHKTTHPAYHNNTFRQFVKQVTHYRKHDPHHLGLIAPQLAKLGVKNPRFILLSNLETELAELFNSFSLKLDRIGPGFVFNESKQLFSQSEIGPATREDYFNIPQNEIVNYPYRGKSCFYTPEILETIHNAYKRDLPFLIGEHPV